MTTSRQLAAIMFTDIVGYTTLMGKDSAKALKLLQTSKQIQKPLVEKHQGQWLKEIGDGVLAKFQTATDAVNCALEIQRASRADFRAEFRIGIHLGDITIENEDVYGDGVNIASRLEAVADPGGIYISESIEKAIRGQVKVELKYLGEINLKNVDYGVRTYAIQGVGLPVPGGSKRYKSMVLFKWSVAIPIVILFALGTLYFSSIFQIGQQDSRPAEVATHLQIALPSDTYLAAETDYPVLAVSPDGSTVVFVGVKSGKRQLYLKRMDDPEIHVLAGTEDSIHPFFSTNGNWIGFIRGTVLMKMPVAGGVPRAVHHITPMSVNRGITWYKEDSLIHTPSPDGGLMISAASGEGIRPITEWKSLLTQEPYYWPNAISEINSVLFTDFQSNLVEDQNVILYSLDDNAMKTLINGGSFPKYSENHILFAREGSLFCAAFEPMKQEVIDEEQLIVSSLYTNINGSALFAVGGKTLVYVEGRQGMGTEQLVWVERDGNIQTIFNNGTDLLYPRISPEGDKIAITSFDGPNSDLWLLELDRSTLARLTSHSGEDFGPVWSPDGKNIAFSSEIAQERGEDGPGIALLEIDSNDPPKRYLSSPDFGYWEFPLSWSPDGEWLLFASTSGSPVHSLEMLRLSDSKRKSWEQSTFMEAGGVFSPDGSWIAYVSDLSGRDQVYVKSVFGEGARIQVSVDGGYEPLWSRDGKEIFYREYEKLMVVPIKNNSPMTLGSPELLFEGSFKVTDYGGKIHNYDISHDGKRFVMINQTSQNRPRVINVILNWDRM